MKRQDMIDTMRSMGWWPLGFPDGRHWVGVSNGVWRLFRDRQCYGYPEDDVPPGEVYGTRIYDYDDYTRDNDPARGRWAYMCDDEVLRFYLKIMMEGL